MSNDEHAEWLLEGAECWNARWERLGKAWPGRTSQLRATAGVCESDFAYGLDFIPTGK